MNPRLFFQQGKLRVFPINTIIGGVASTISTKALLATKLGIAESIIKRFDIVGSDVQAHISADYDIGSDSFLNNSSITHYNDIDSRVKNVSSQAFRGSSIIWFKSNSCNVFSNDSFRSCLNFENCNTPSLHTLGTNVFNSSNKLKDLTHSITTFGTTCFSGVIIPILNLNTTTLISGNGFFFNAKCTQIHLANITAISNVSQVFSGTINLELIDIKKVKIFGSDSTASTNTFSTMKIGCEIRANIHLATSNSGSPNATIFWAKTNRAAVVKFYDDAGNYVSTL